MYNPLEIDIEKNLRLELAQKKIPGAFSLTSAMFATSHVCCFSRGL
jgi:hypothetical protein